MRVNDQSHGNKTSNPVLSIRGKIEGLERGFLVGWIEAAGDETISDLFIVANGYILERIKVDYAVDASNTEIRHGTFRCDARNLPPSTFLADKINFEICLDGAETRLIDRSEIECDAFRCSRMFKLQANQSQLDGFIDEFASGTVRGWVRDRMQESRRLRLYLFVNDRFAGCYLASLNRVDLMHLTSGDCAYGFNIDASSFFEKFGGVRKKVQLITEEPECWSIQMAPHAKPRRIALAFGIPRFRKSSGSSFTSPLAQFVEALAQEGSFPKRIFDIHRLASKMPDAFSSEYTLLALDFLRREAVENGERLKSGGNGRLRAWIRLKLIEFQMKRLTHLAYAISASQDLAKNATSRSASVEKA